MFKRMMWGIGFFVMLAYCVTCYTTTIYAETPLQSTNYKIDETIVGGGGQDKASSANHQIDMGINDLSIGESSTENFIIHAGSKTTPEPTLSFIITNPAATFNNFSPTTPSTTTANFSVLNYTSWGYVVQIVGTPPTNGAHTIAAMPSVDTSQPGKEQFGINLVANVTPTSFGANPKKLKLAMGTQNPSDSAPLNF